MSQRFHEKVVIVTGAAGGIGLAAARSFAAEGARVVLADRDVDGVERAAVAIVAEGGIASAVEVDITDFASCERMVVHAVSTYGALHIAFNNAGIPSGISPSFEDITVDEWQRVIGTNLSGTFYCMKAETPALKAAGGGAIVNTASVMSLIAAPGMSSYVASKHAVAGLTKATALDLVPYGIRVNAVCPGFIETPMLAPVVADEGVRRQIEGSAPAKRLGQPQEVADAVLFLASDSADYIVGALLSVDGGVAVL
ncbi:MAG: short-chain dehydrogenase/reductase [Subtercola sp.]|nr:short-chain dehydrogenase/reductase [Subtercola sp.]